MPTGLFPGWLTDGHGIGIGIGIGTGAGASALGRRVSAAGKRRGTPVETRPCEQAGGEPRDRAVPERPDRQPARVLFVVDGPSGSGKTHLMRYVRRQVDPAAAIPKLTTRPPGARDRDGWSDLRHVTPAEFERARPEYRYERDGHRYGLAGSALREGLAAGAVAFVVVRDVATIRRIADDLTGEASVVPVFVHAGAETRRRRLELDGLGPDDVRRRLDADADPLAHHAAHAAIYRHLLANDATVDEFHDRIRELIATWSGGGQRRGV